MIKYFALFITFSIALNTAISQNVQQTLYEKKVHSLQIQYCRELGIDEGQLEQFSKMGEMEKLLVSSNLLNKISTERGMLITMKYNRLFKDAEKLKTDVDYKRERFLKEKKAIAEKEAKIKNEVAEREAQNRRLVAEKEAKIKTDIQDENNRKLNSDYIKIQNEIKQEFSNWSNKGEFEKTEQYELRLTNDAQNNFEKICINSITHSIETLYDNNTFRTELLNYNADNEYFLIHINYNYKLEWTDSLKISISDAEKFKENFVSRKLSIDQDDWRIDNYYWQPKRITLSINDKLFNLNIPYKSEMALIFKASDFGLSQSKFKDINFNWNEYKIQIEKERKEKAAKVERERIEREAKEEQDRKIAAAKAEQDRIEKEAKEEQERKIEAAKQKKEIYFYVLYNSLDNIHKNNRNQIENQFNIPKPIKQTNNGDNSLVHSAITLIGSTSNLDEHKRNVFNNYIIILNHFKAKILSSNTPEECELAEKVNYLDSQVLKLKSRSQIKDISNKLKDNISYDDIEKIFFTISEIEFKKSDFEAMYYNENSSPQTVPINYLIYKTTPQ